MARAESLLAGGAKNVGLTSTSRAGVGRAKCAARACGWRSAPSRATASHRSRATRSRSAACFSGSAWRARAAWKTRHGETSHLGRSASLTGSRVGTQTRRRCTGPSTESAASAAFGDLVRIECGRQSPALAPPSAHPFSKITAKKKAKIIFFFVFSCVAGRERRAPATTHRGALSPHECAARIRTVPHRADRNAKTTVESYFGAVAKNAVHSCDAQHNATNEQAARVSAFAVASASLVLVFVVVARRRHGHERSGSRLKKEQQGEGRRQTQEKRASCNAPGSPWPTRAFGTDQSTRNTHQWARANLRRASVCRAVFRLLFSFLSRDALSQRHSNAAVQLRHLILPTHAARSLACAPGEPNDKQRHTIRLTFSPQLRLCDCKTDLREARRRERPLA